MSFVRLLLLTLGVVISKGGGGSGGGGGVMASQSITFNLTGLVAYWSFNGNVKNAVTGISLFNQQKATRFVSNRLGRANSSLYFESAGSAQIPQGVYFSKGAFVQFRQNDTNE